MAKQARREPTLITSVSRALRLLEAVSGHDGGAPAKLLARQAGLPLATAYHLLRTLTHEGYLRKLDGGCFVLGERVGLLQRHGHAQALLSRVRPTLSALRDELSAATYLSLFDEGEIHIMEIVDGPRAPRVDLWVGCSDAGHATALGKCILRELPAQARLDYLSRHPLVDLTPRTLTHPTALQRDLAGSVGSLVTDREEYALGTGCAAVPVIDGDRICSLAVSVPVRRLGEVVASRDRLLATAGRVSRALSL